ncbi:MAG TPA: hypothetical protein VGL91_19725 [Acidobacteriota bacterium]
MIPFILYGVRGLADGLRSQLSVIRQQQWDVAWQNFVHQSFRDKGGSAYERKQQLVLDLSKESQPVPLTKLSEISPRIAKAYANKTAKTLSRDVNQLIEMHLIKREENGLVAFKDILLAFLPVTAQIKKPQPKEPPTLDIERVLAETGTEPS